MAGGRYIGVPFPLVMCCVDDTVDKGLIMNEPRFPELLKSNILPGWLLEITNPGRAFHDLPEGIGVFKLQFQDAWHVFLWVDDLNGVGKDNFEAADARLQDTFHTLTGIATAIDGANSCSAKIVGTKWVHEDGVWGVVIRIEAGIAGANTLPWRRLSGDGARADELKLWLRLATEYKALKIVLRHLHSDANWFELWRVYEVVQHIVPEGIVKSGLASSDEDVRFKTAASEPCASGDSARHTDVKSRSAPERARARGTPWRIGHGRCFIVGLVRRLMLRVKQSPEAFRWTMPVPHIETPPSRRTAASRAASRSAACASCSSSTRAGTSTAACLARFAGNAAKPIKRLRLS